MEEAERVTCFELSACSFATSLASVMQIKINVMVCVIMFLMSSTSDGWLSHQPALHVL